MEISLFFNSLDESLTKELYGDTLGSSIATHVHRFPDWANAHIALIGVAEERGTSSNQGTKEGPDVIRKKLYQLKKSNAPYTIVDLGNLRLGITLDETYSRLREVCEILMLSNTIPIIIGGSHDLDYGQYMAYEKLERMITVLNIDAFLDLEQNTDHHLAHTSYLLTHTPNYLFNFAQLGYQSYLNTPEQILTLQKFSFDLYRLGEIRENIEHAEPIIRDADMVSFDITAVQLTNAPGNYRAQPFGLNGEEACQLSWYAGISDRVSSIGFYEYNPSFDQREQTASLIATMIWYFIEGFYQRKGSRNFKEADFLKYQVTFPDQDMELVFLKHKWNEKWWMEVATASDAIAVIACTYTDYKLALEGILPDRWLSFQSKLL